MNKQIEYECCECGKSFIDFKSNCRKYCSQECAKKGLSKQLKNSRMGENNPYYRDYDVYCKICGKGINRERRSLGKYCSFKCMGIDRKNNKNIRWKGGITPLRQKIARTVEYKTWRMNVFKRDNYICYGCGQVGGDLEVHHIIPFHVLRDEAITYFPLLDSFDACMLYDKLWEISNGITLCEDCHKKIPAFIDKYDILNILNKKN